MAAGGIQECASGVGEGGGCTVPSSGSVAVDVLNQLQNHPLGGLQCVGEGVCDFKMNGVSSL